MPTATYDSESNTLPVLVPTPEWTKVTRRPTEESINIEHDDDDTDWSYEVNDDNEFNPAPCDMFEMNHPTSPPA